MVASNVRKFFLRAALGVVALATTLRFGDAHAKDPPKLPVPLPGYQHTCEYDKKTLYVYASERPNGNSAWGMYPNTIKDDTRFFDFDRIIADKLPGPTSTRGGWAVFGAHGAYSPVKFETAFNYWFSDPVVRDVFVPKDTRILALSCNEWHPRWLSPAEELARQFPGRFVYGVHPDSLTWLTHERKTLWGAACAGHITDDVDKAFAVVRYEGMGNFRTKLLSANLVEDYLWAHNIHVNSTMTMMEARMEQNLPYPSCHPEAQRRNPLIKKFNANRPGIIIPCKVPMVDIAVAAAVPPSVRRHIGEAVGRSIDMGAEVPTIRQWGMPLMVNPFRVFKNVSEGTPDVIKHIISVPGAIVDGLFVQPCSNFIWGPDPELVSPWI